MSRGALRLFALASLSLIACALCVNAQITYSLRCRGPLLDTHMYILTGATSYVTATFVPGTAGAINTPVPQSTCTWMDRGLNSNEPRWIQATVRGTANFYTDVFGLNTDGEGWVDFSAWASNPNDANSATSVDVLNHLSTLLSQDVTYNFNAYNNEAGYMVLVSVDYILTPAASKIVDQSQNPPPSAATNGDNPLPPDTHNSEGSSPTNLAIGLVGAFICGVLTAIIGAIVYKRQQANASAQPVPPAATTSFARTEFTPEE